MTKTNIAGKLGTSTSVAALALAVGLGLSSPAVSADLGTFKPAAPAAINWHGGYFGAHLGTGEMNFSGIFNTDSSAVYFDLLDHDGPLVGFQLGYNWDRGNGIIWGIEGDLSFMDWTSNQQSVNSSEEADANTEMMASIRGRLGVAVDDDRKGMLYTTLGLAWTDTEADVYNSTRNNASEVAYVDFDDVGVVFGGGFEWAATNTFRLRAEGLYYWFDDKELVDYLSDANPGDHIELDDAFVVRMAGSWYFNTTR